MTMQNVQYWIDQKFREAGNGRSVRRLAFMVMASVVLHLFAVSTVHAQVVSVPNVIGFTQTDAEAAITIVGLTIGTVMTMNSDTVPSGNVISQTPGAGTDVETGSAVDLVISDGLAQIPVPNLEGLTEAAAETALIGLGLIKGAVTTASSLTVPAGIVMGQNPAPGIEVPAGSPVALVVSAGPAFLEVPNVVGQTEEAATLTLTLAGLTKGNVTRMHHASVPAGNVISQDPVAGAEVPLAAPVDLTVSDGPAPVEVPNVVGQTEAAAATMLTNAGLTKGAVTRVQHASVPAGNVINQNPAAGAEVVPGSAVALTVSEGPEPVEVPNVAGQTEAEATTTLTNAGLTKGAVTRVQHASVPAGNVISQDPAAGEEVPPGTAVALTVSEGPEPVEVPNVVGQTEAEATTTLTNAGLIKGAVTRVHHASVPEGRVISQDPEAGEEAAPESAVDLEVSDGPVPVEVPDVKGLTEAEASSVLTDAGLTKGTVTRVHHASVPAGRVISQTPAAGEEVPPDSAVALEVSDGPAPVEVPNVMGLTEAEATTVLTEAGFVKGSVSMAHSTSVPAGEVISQRPAAGDEAVPESTVDLVISSGPPVFLMGVQNDPNIGPLVNSLYRMQTDGVVTKVGDLDHRTHGLAFNGGSLYSVEELTLSSPGTPPNLYRINPETGATLTVIPLSLSTGESLEGGVGLATEPGTNQLWALLIVPSEENHSRRLVKINPATGVATQVAKIAGRFVDMAFDTGGTLYAITDNFPVPGGSPVLPARIYTLNTTSGAATEFLDVSAGAVAGQPNFRESETIGMGFSSDLLYHLSGQNKQTTCCTKNILSESIHLTTKARTSVPITGPEFFVTTALSLIPSTGPSSRILEDLDGNGKADLVWRNTNNGTTAVWFMNGAAIASSSFPGGVPLTWQIAGVGDVNGDEQADVIWRNQINGTVAVWLMNGSTISSVGFPGSASTDFQISGVGDVNGDGKADLMWRNTNNGTTAIWLMNGTSLAGSGFPGGVPPAWQIAGVGDVNGDERADVIWRNQNGTVAVWLMNGTSISSVGFPGGSASLDWEIQ